MQPGLISLHVDPSQVATALEAERVALARRVRLATEKTGREALLQPARDMVARSFKSKKLPTTWRAALYPGPDQHTLSPAFFISSRAPNIVAAFESGATIKAKGGRFLAIPTVESGRYGRHFLKGALTPEKWVKENRTALIFRPTSYGGVLISELQRFRTGKRKGKKTRSVVTKRQKPIVVFILVRQVRLAKRLDLKRLAEQAGASYRSSYEKAANAA